MNTSNQQQQTNSVSPTFFTETQDTPVTTAVITGNGVKKQKTKKRNSQNNDNNTQESISAGTSNIPTFTTHSLVSNSLVMEEQQVKVKVQPPKKKRCARSIHLTLIKLEIVTTLAHIHIQVDIPKSQGLLSQSLLLSAASTEGLLLTTIII